MKDYAMGFVAILAMMAGFGMEHLRPAPVLTPTKVIEHKTEVQTVGKYGWGALSKTEQDAAVAAIGDLDRREVQIFCNTPGCSDLAEDIDEIMDRVHAASNVQRSIVELGGGMGISPSEPATKKIADALREATNGRVDLQLLDVPQPGGGVVIVLGRKPRH